MHIPDFLIKLGQENTRHQPWVEQLPDVIDQFIDEWSLELGEPFTENASCSFVAPCMIDGENQAVLKIGLPHEEALHEIEGLQILDGQPTVRLLNYDKSANAMLLERCIPGTQLSEIDENRQDEIISEILKEVWETNFQGSEIRPLSEMVDYWNEGASANLHKFSDQGLAKAGFQLKQELIESSKQHVLLATDLHAGNVLKAQRRPWLAIDIKPYFGDPAYDLTQHLLNCKKRLRISPKTTINRLALLAGVKQKRLQQWMFARLASEDDGKNQELAMIVNQVAN